MQSKYRGTVKNLWNFNSILLMQLPVMRLMCTDVELNVHFMFLNCASHVGPSICKTTEVTSLDVHPTTPLYHNRTLAYRSIVILLIANNK
jgi:hypothetical protein